jgi:hypothetical protein
MIPEFKVGDLVKYHPSEEFVIGDGGTQTIWREDAAQAVITGFYDNETGERLSGDFTTHDKVVEVSVAGSNGIERVFMTELELVSSADEKLC